MEKRKNFMSKVELCKLICYLIDHEYENPQVYSYIKVVSFHIFGVIQKKSHIREKLRLAF